MDLNQRDVTLVFDDLDPGFQYEGAWQELTGSTRQWSGGVRSTQQTGASVNFTFFGTGIILYQTVQSGAGSVTVDVSVDGSPPQTVSTPCGGDQVFANAFFTSDPLAEINHTVVITNKGEPSIPFQFDRADIRAELAPTVWQPSQTNALFASSTPVMVIGTQTPTNIIRTQSTTSLQTSKSSRATSSPGSHTVSPSVLTSAATSVSITPPSLQTNLAPPASQTITETDNPGTGTTQNPATAVATSAPGRQAKPTLITLAVVLACLITVVITLLLVCLMRQWRSRVSKLQKGYAADKLTRGDATRPDPFTLDFLHPDHMAGGSPIDRSKRDTSIAGGAHTRIPDSPPDYQPVIN